MAEYHNGRFSSREQALAVSYSQVGKSRPNCRRHLQSKGRRKSRRNSKSKTRRKSNRVRSRRKSNRVRSRRKIKRSRRHSRSIDVKSVNTKDDKKDIVSAKDGKKMVGAKDVKKKKMTTGKKVGLAVGGTLAGLTAGYTGVYIGGVLNSPQAKELKKIASSQPGSKEEAAAIREHLEQEDARLGKAIEDGSVYAKKFALRRDTMRSGILKENHIRAQYSKALAEGDTEGAAKLTELLGQNEKNFEDNMAKLKAMKTDKELEDYVATRKKAIGDQLEKLRLTGKLEAVKAEHAVKSNGDEVALDGEHAVESDGDSAVALDGDSAFKAATIASEEGTEVAGETLVKTAGESLLSHIIF